MKKLSYFALFCMLLSAACSKQTKTVVTTQQDNKDKYLDSLFTDAISQAQNPTQDKIYNKLTPILGNPQLIDTLINEQRYVLMVSWKSHPENYPKSGPYNTSIYDIWVTAAPQIQDRCKTYFKTLKDPELRLQQLLGLQPDTQETIFLELWVKPADMFRPCPDNGIDDTACQLNLPEHVTPYYRKWFNNIRAIQYTDCSDKKYQNLGYPWTQLGYTFDWSPDNPSHIGLSEFVIRQNSDVYVRNELTTTQYCTQ